MAKIDPPHSPPWLNPRKGRDQILQRSGAIVQKPEGPNTNHLKIWLLPSGNHDLEHVVESLAAVTVTDDVNKGQVQVREICVVDFVIDPIVQVSDDL